MTTRRARPSLLGYGLLAPSLFGVVCFLLLPMLVVVWLSLHRWDLLGPIHYVGLDNWRSVLGDRTFGNSPFVTLAFIALVVPAQIVLGWPPRHCSRKELPGSGLLSAPCTSCHGSAHHWPSRCCGAGFWRHRRGGQHRAGRRIEWLTDPGLALPVVSAVTVWTNVGYVALFFLAGILAIPRRCTPPPGWTARRFGNAFTSPRRC